MHSFSFHAPTRLFFGEGCLQDLGAQAKALGSRVLLVYGGGSIKRTGVYDQIKAQLQDCTVFELPGVEPNPRVSTVNAGAEICKAQKIDFVLAAGGGSSMDCAKAICAAACYDGDAWELVKDNSKVSRALPLICVVTLAATGSEYDCGGVITNLETKEKMSIVHPLLWPYASFIDPTFTYSVPAYQTAAGSCDIISHYLEQYFTAGCNDIGAGFLESELRAVIKYAPLALQNPQDAEARAHLSWAAALGCTGLLSLGCTPSAFVCHAIEHELSAYYDITHGIGLALITPAVMRYILSEKTAPRLAQFARNVMGIELADEMQAAKAGIDALERFFKSIGVPESLKSLNIDETYFKAMAVHAGQCFPLLQAWVPLEASDVEAILKASL